MICVLFICAVGAIPVVDNWMVTTPVYGWWTRRIQKSELDPLIDEIEQLAIFKLPFADRTTIRIYLRGRV